MGINTITPGSQQGLSQLPFWLQARKVHSADLRLGVSPDFTFSSLIFWGKVYLSLNILNFHSLIIWNTWLTITKSTVWGTSGYLAIRYLFSFLSLIPLPFLSHIFIQPLLCSRIAINIYDREMIMWESCFSVYG